MCIKEANILPHSRHDFDCDSTVNHNESLTLKRPLKLSMYAFCVGLPGWMKANLTPFPVAATEAKATRAHGSFELDSELGQWIVWARHKADWIDPLVNAKCPVLDDE